MRNSFSMQHLLILGVLAITGGLGWSDWTGMPQLPDGLQVRPDNRYFDVSPRIAPADTETTVVITPLFTHRSFKDDCTYLLTYTALDQVRDKKSPPQGMQKTVKPVDGRITVPLFLAGEQEHLLRLEEFKDDKSRVVGEFHLFSLRPDLFALRPFKGDFHMHSHRSDGVESPAYVAGACRRAGLDFMALTDHRCWAGSQEAISAFKDAPIDLKIFGGEEIHVPDNPVHIVAFGNNAGVGELYLGAAETACKKEVAERSKKLKKIPDDVNKYQYAACQWAIEKIHERGGLAMLCHPFWVTGGAHNIADPLLRCLLDKKNFDLLELVSGNGSDGALSYDSTFLQSARYQQDRVEGLKIPVCGISDAHGCEGSETFGRNFTIVFASDAELPTLQSAMKSGNTVAVEIMRGDRPQAYGDFRLVKYAMFLVREIIPQHDELCQEEGRLMLGRAAGDTGAAPRLQACQGQVKALYDRYWGGK